MGKNDEFSLHPCKSVAAVTVKTVNINPVILSKKVVLKQNPSLPEIDMRRLFSEKGRTITNLATRRGLVKNPNTPIDILIELSKDNKKYIRSDALRHPKMKQYLKTEQDK